MSTISTKVLRWKDFEYTPKSFNLERLYDLLEAIGDAQGDLKLAFRAQLKNLLKGTDPASQEYINTDKLGDDLLRAESDDDLAIVFEFQEELDFLLDDFMNKRDKLKKSAPNLAPVIDRATQKASRQTSRKDMSSGPAQSA